MKADRDDAPDYVKHKRTSPIGIALITAACLIAGALFMVDRSGWMDFAKHFLNPAEPHRTQMETSVSAKGQSASANAEEPFWEAVESKRRPREPAPTPPAVRQTSFNDSNYRPRTNINIMPPPPQQYVQASSQTRSSRQTQKLNGSNATTLTWGDGAWWRGSYRWRDSVINYDDLCRSNGYPRKGSIEYRACRREAKTYLRTECRSGRNKSQDLRRVYCHAEDAFRH